MRGSATRLGEDRTDAPKRPVRPRELQDRLNYHLYHPLAWQLALRLARTPITPNAVSVIGGAFVVAAAVVYAQMAGPGGALLGMLLHMTWHVVDGADGDLARLTGRSSPIGELVDGLCDYISHIVLYLVLGTVLQGQIGAGWAWFLTISAGLSHIVQANHVEVQRRSYQYWVYGTPWLRNTHGREDSATRRGGFGGLVSAYLALASGMTPYALRIDAATRAAENDPDRLATIRAVVRREALPLFTFLKILGPNPRAIVLGLSMLAGSAAYYFIYYAAVLNLVLVASVILHNSANRRMAAELGLDERG